MKISNFIIGLILVTVIGATFQLAIGDFANKYDVTYDNESLEVFSSSQELIQLTENIKDKEANQNTESGLLDVVGEYISKAVDTLKVAKASLNTYDDMTEAASENLGLPSFFTTAFYAIGIIIIILGVIVSAMIKKDL